MIQENKHITLWKKVAESIRAFCNREGEALFVAISVLAGTSAFFALAIRSGAQQPVWWGWPSLVAALLILPTAYRIVRMHKGPDLIRFSRGFAIGFFSAFSLLQTGSTHWQKRFRTWWQKIVQETAKYK